MRQECLKSKKKDDCDPNLDNCRVVKKYPPADYSGKHVFSLINCVEYFPVVTEYIIN